jgi:hypothetical protein
LYEEDILVKTNDSNFLIKNKINLTNDYYIKSLILPKEYEISDELKHEYLSELANAFVDWC